VRRVEGSEVFCYGAGFVERGASGVGEDEGGDAGPGVAGGVGGLLGSVRMGV
jgi:hypothetical protein